MDERVAEFKIKRMDLDDKVDTLRKAICSKTKHLEKVMGNEDLYRSGTRTFTGPRTQGIVTP
jgi:hypothetical protein